MASSFEKSVKGATKIKAAPPKTKYIEHILVATHSGEAGVGEVFRALQHRLRDHTWTVVFKGLITTHLMIREGSPNVTLAYLAKHRNLLAVSMFSDAQTQGRNIRHYSNYLSERARAYRETRLDWVRGADTRLEKLTVDKGLLRETETVQHQLTALLKCDVLDNEVENEITITVFRLLVLDLLALFQVLNQAMINILGHFFFMSKPDAERAMDIYRTFTRQTDYVVQYLSVARQYEHHTRVEVPKLKHAPVNLGRQLQEYLNDADFEVHRRQYLAEQESSKAKGGSKALGTGNAKSTVNGTQSAPRSTGKGPESNLIDFFESIEQNQTQMALRSPHAGQPGLPSFHNNSFQTQQPNGFGPQPTGFQSGFQTTGAFQQQNMQLQQTTSFPTGVGFANFSPQTQLGFQPTGMGTVPQDSVASFQTGFQGMSPNQTTNPFRSSIVTQQTGFSVQSPNPGFTPQLPQMTTAQSTNPFGPTTFAQSNQTMNTNTSPFLSSPPQATPLMPMATGTNPFIKSNYVASPPLPQVQRPMTAGAHLMSQPTGTNPFRQSPGGSQPTGLGFGQTTIGGGLDHMQAISVFPRQGQGQPSPWQQ